MNESPSDHPPQPHDPLAALRQPPFVVYTLSRVGSSVGNSMLQAILLWHVYALTGDPLSLGFLGLARFLPALGVSMVGGAVADVYNRRNVIMVAQTVPLAGGVVLAVATLGDWVTPAMIYGLVLVVGLASAFENPARLALLPSIVRPETFANAVTVSSTLQSLGMVTGGLVGGVIVVWDPGAAYIAYSAAIGWAFMMMAVLRYEQRDGARRSVSLQAIKEGLGFVRRNQPIWGAMSLDMFAVIFGGAKGLLPVYASDILHAGGLGYGLLIASLEIGAFLMSAALVLRPPIVRTGRALVYSVVAFGLLTIGFGLSENLYLSIALYMAIGAADQVSVVMRNVIIQLATPDALRGRVSSVNQVFIQASNQLGAMESGFVAAATSAVFAVVSGGVAAVAIAALFGWRLKGLFDYRQPRAFESQEQTGTVAAAHGGLSAGEAAGSS
ncbi:MAG TPA: MFS transporter [Dehalococcoidia bacterium]|nr:MFS transporter [Dehalococcoidia bacterium]